MGQESNDLKQMKEVRLTLSNVYKSQVNDSIVDNGNLTEIHNALLNVQNVIKWLEKNQPKE